MFSRITPVLKILLILNITVYFLDSFLFKILIIDGVPLSYWIMKYFALQPIGGFMTTSGMEFLFYPWQLITYQFMHGGFSHLFFNMFALWMFSSELEERWGSAKFLVYYLLSGIGAGLLHMLISSVMGSTAPTIGASGSLYGVIIGYAMLNPERKIMMFPIFIPIPARVFGIGMMIFSVILGVTSSDGVAHFAHFGGALTGLILTKWGEKTPLFKITRKYIKFGLPPMNEYTNTWGSYNTGYRRVQQQQYNNPYNQYNRPQVDVDHNSNQPKQVKLTEIDVGGIKVTQETIDAILDKISKTGYHSLTEQEKYILTEISKHIK